MRSSYGGLTFENYRQTCGAAVSGFHMEIVRGIRDDARMRCSRALMWSQVLVSSVAVVACAKGSNATPRPGPAAGSGSAQHPAVAPSPKTGSGDDKLEVVWDRTEPFCPRDKGPRKTSARMIGVWIRVIPQEVGYALQYRKPKAAYEINVFDDADKVIETIPGAAD